MRTSGRLSVLAATAVTAVLAIMAPDAATAGPKVPTPPTNSGKTGVATKPTSVPGYARHAITPSTMMSAKETCTAAGKDGVSVCLAPTAPKRDIAVPKASSAAAIPFPDWCAASTGTPVAGSRTEACQVNGLLFTTRRITNGVTTVTGEVSMNVFNYTFANASMPNWQHQIGIAPATGWGDAALAIVAGTFEVDGDCYTLGTPDFAPQFLSPLNNVPRTGTAGAETTATAVGATGDCTTTWNLAFNAPGYTTATTWYNMSETDCDNATGANGSRPQRVGCVVWWFPAMVLYSQSRYPSLAAHVSIAQNSGLPGAGFEDPLHRNETDATVNLNRSRACGNPPSIPGKSCDEYPLATTYEGLAFGGTLRSFTGCNISAPTNVTGPTGASACMITASENHAQGGLMAAFYYDNRVLAGDPYRVGIGS